MLTYMQDYAASLSGFVIYGSIAYTQLYSAAPAGDINGDGVGDLLLGDAKAARLVLGQAAPRSVNIDIATANAISFYSPAANMSVTSVDGGQDVNGDGFPDLLLGSSNAESVWLLPGPFDIPPDPSAAPTVLCPRRVPPSAPVWFRYPGTLATHSSPVMRRALSYKALAKLSICCLWLVNKRSQSWLARRFTLIPIFPLVMLVTSVSQFVGRNRRRHPPSI